MSNNYKVLKLRSGDSVVAELIENSKSHIRVDRPMEIKYMHFIDALGRKHETLILVDWLKSTTLNTVKLEKDFILGIFTPEPDVVQSYKHQKDLDDNNGKIPPTKRNHLGMFSKINQEGIENLINQMEEELIEEIIETSKQERMIDETSDPNYGTSYCDWSPDPEDYLS